MSILATDNKLISFGTDYSAGSGISIIDHTISIVPSAVGKTYSAGPNIEIYDVSGQPTISSKDWSSDIANASANAYEQAVSQIPEPQDLSYISATVDKNTSGIDYISSVCLTSHKDWTDTIKDASANSYTQSTSYFNDWVNGQYTGDIANITNNITALSGDLSGYYKKTETSSKEQINDALQYVSAHAVGDVEVNNYVHNNSATIDEVNSAYKANSASYITAHQSLEGYATESWVTAQGYLTGVNIPESATWNEASNVVSSNSASWSEGKTYTGISPIVVNNDENVVSANTWTLSAGDGVSLVDFSADRVTRIDVTAQGGGGSVSSKYGTISVDGSNIEATNKAIEFNSNGFTSSFDSSSCSNTTPVVLTWDNYSQGTSIHVEVYCEGHEDATLTYSSNTNVTGEVTGAPWNPINLDVQIPNATAIQFTTDKYFRLQGPRVSAPSSFKVKELAWKSDLPTYNYNSNHKVSAINGNELVGNEDYLVEQGFVQNLTSPKGTVSVLNNNKVEGTNSAIASDVIEGFVSSYNGVSVYPEHSATLTWDRYVPNTMLFVSGTEYSEHTLTYSANTDVTGVITTPIEGQVSFELPTDSTSIVIGHEDWSNITFNFTVSADNYYEIGELAWASALPSFEYDSTNKISAINGSAIAGGSDVPSGTMNVSGLEYNAVNEISAYNGSAIAQYGAEKQWLVHDDTLVHVANSAQYALGVNVSALQRLMGIDETVLWSGSETNISSFTVSEPLTNFKEVAFYVTPTLSDGISPVKVSIPMIGRNTAQLDFTFNTTWAGFTGINFTYSYNQTGMSSFALSTGGWFGYNADGAITGSFSNLYGYKIVGIGRKA